MSARRESSVVRERVTVDEILPPEPFTLVWPTVAMAVTGHAPSTEGYFVHAPDTERESDTPLIG